MKLHEQGLLLDGPGHRRVGVGVKIKPGGQAAHGLKMGSSLNYLVPFAP